MSFKQTSILLKTWHCGSGYYQFQHVMIYPFLNENTYIFVNLSSLTSVLAIISFWSFNTTKLHKKIFFLPFLCIYYDRQPMTDRITRPCLSWMNRVIHRFSRLVTLLFHKWLHMRLNHKDACILTLT